MRAGARAGGAHRQWECQGLREAERADGCHHGGRDQPERRERIWYADRRWPDLPVPQRGRWAVGHSRLLWLCAGDVHWFVLAQFADQHVRHLPGDGPAVRFNAQAGSCRDQHDQRRTGEQLAHEHGEWQRCAGSHWLAVLHGSQWGNHHPGQAADGQRQLQCSAHLPGAFRGAGCQQPVRNRRRARPSGLHADAGRWPDRHDLDQPVRDPARAGGPHVVVDVRGGTRF